MFTYALILVLNGTPLTYDTMEARRFNTLEACEVAAIVEKTKQPELDFLCVPVK